jgi:hypothetical protein
MYQWILRQQQEGMRVTTIDIVSHLQVLFPALYCFNCLSSVGCFLYSFDGKKTNFFIQIPTYCIVLSNLGCIYQAFICLQLIGSVDCFECETVIQWA